MSPDTTLVLQRCLDRLNAGDAAAREELLTAACGRLNRLARKMFRAETRLRQWQETGDVFQGAMVRLCRALGDITPSSPRAFYRLAALQIRRELIDLARHFYGPAGTAARLQSHTLHLEDAGSPPASEPADLTLEPARLTAWSEFHQQIGELPEEERDVFD